MIAGARCPEEGLDPALGGCALTEKTEGRELQVWGPRGLEGSYRGGAHVGWRGAQRSPLSLTFSEQLNSRCWILVASWMLICFNLRICRSECVFTEIMMPTREEGLVAQQQQLRLDGRGRGRAEAGGCQRTTPGKSVFPFTMWD